MIVAFEFSLSFAKNSVKPAFMFKSLKIWNAALRPASVPAYSGLDSAKARIMSVLAVTRRFFKGFRERLRPGFIRQVYSGSKRELQAVMLVKPVNGFKLP